MAQCRDVHLPSLACFSVRHCLERRPHRGLTNWPCARVSRDRYRQPAAALLRSRSRRGAGRGLSRGSGDTRRICFCRRNTPTSGDRTIVCPTILPRRLAVQVAQSLASSLEHLGTDYVDSFVLHGPASGDGWTEHDSEVWEAMRKERDAGRTRLLGVSNVSLEHLEQMKAAARELPDLRAEPLLRARRLGPRSAAFCREHEHHLSGILAAHGESEVLQHRSFDPACGRAECDSGPGVFAFARQSECCRSRARPAPSTCGRTWRASN